MSNQFEEIGRLVAEQANVNKHQAALRREVERCAKGIVRIGALLAGGLGPENIRRAISALDEFENNGGLLKLKAALSDYELDSIELTRLDRKLKDAGLP